MMTLADGDERTGPVGPPATTPEEWLGVTRQEYFEAFIPDGGAALKFVVPLDDRAGLTVASELARSGSELGFLVVQVSASETRIHMMDQLFFEIADQIDWQRLSQQVIVRLARDKAFSAPEDGDGSLLDRIARANGLEPEFLLRELRLETQERVSKQRRLSRDFRVAMTHLCLAELTGGDDGMVRVRVITEWLTGRNNRISAVRPYEIFNRISRTNARHLFESMLRWVRFAGYPGTLILLDTARLTVARNPRDGAQYYTKPAVLDAYELLRQFIDGTDRLRGCFIVVVPDLAFLDEDQVPRSRGIGAYEALKFRVIDEVRDRRLVNPMASLVRLSSEPQGYIP